MAPPVGQLLLVLLVLEERYFGAKMTMDAIANAQLQQHPNKLQSAPAGDYKRGEFGGGKLIRGRWESFGGGKVWLSGGRVGCPSLDVNEI